MHALQAIRKAGKKIPHPKHSAKTRWRVAAREYSTCSLRKAQRSLHTVTAAAPTRRHHGANCPSGSHRNPALNRLVATRPSPQPASPNICRHHYHSSRTPPVHGSGLSASSALILRLLHSSRAVAAVGSEPPVAGKRSGPSGERAAGREECVGDVRVSYGATAEAEGEAAERRRNLEDGREEGRGRVWDEVREVDRKAEARGGVALADGDEDMSGYGVASAEDLRKAKQIADAILSGRFFAGMSRGKRHWAGDDAGESGGEDGEVGVKISAVSRKTNTTQREVVGIRTTGPTQLVFHDTPGLTVAMPSQPLSASQRQGSLLASSAALHGHVVALVIDADRQIRRCVSEEWVQGGGWLGSGCKEEGGWGVGARRRVVGEWVQGGGWLGRGCKEEGGWGVGARRRVVGEWVQGGGWLGSGCKEEGGWGGGARRRVVGEWVQGGGWLGSGCKEEGGWGVGARRRVVGEWVQGGGWLGRGCKEEGGWGVGARRRVAGEWVQGGGWLGSGCKEEGGWGVGARRRVVGEWVQGGGWLGSGCKEEGGWGVGARRRVVGEGVQGGGWLGSGCKEEGGWGVGARRRVVGEWVQGGGWLGSGCKEEGGWGVGARRRVVGEWVQGGGWLGSGCKEEGGWGVGARRRVVGEWVQGGGWLGSGCKEEGGWGGGARRRVVGEWVQGGGWLGSGCKEEGGWGVGARRRVVGEWVQGGGWLGMGARRRVVGEWVQGGGWLGSGCKEEGGWGVGARRRGRCSHPPLPCTAMWWRSLLMPTARSGGPAGAADGGGGGGGAEGGAAARSGAEQGQGVNLLEEYLFDHVRASPCPAPPCSHLSRMGVIFYAVQAAWEEDPRLRTDQSPEQLAMQIVRELLLHRMHQEVPYAIEHRHLSCSVLKDGSLRIEQLLLVHSNAQRAMLVGKAGQVVRSIGREARYQLQNILGGPVHLILQVRVDRK
ncbi:unnamed protein product [Closterium sp. Naga37s-1]|nr:unnamed protein product [Closterium sp. Naga37s-1]